MMRFSGGLEAAAWKPITALDALTRTAHTLSGYALFATAVALDAVLRLARTAIRIEQRLMIDSPELETVV